MARSHYDVLGVPSTADATAVRRAYLAHAREAHPDRHIDASSADRAVAERRMQEINEAWHVLGNPRRRRRYDLELAPAASRSTPDPRFTSRRDGTVADDIDYGEVDATTRFIKGLPWLILVVVMFAIFVFTAYAATGGRGGTSPSAECVATDGTTVRTVDCGAPGARRVVSTVDASTRCPAGTERLQPATGPVAYCLEV